MKLSFFFLFFIIAFVSVHGWDIRCPSRDRGNAVLLPDPRNCGRFYICSNGTPIRQNCPSGLRFNPRLSVCDWPRNVPCRRSVEEESYNNDEDTDQE